MKRLLLLLAISATVGTAAMAQDQKDMKKDHAEWDKKIKDELKLNPDQTVKYDALNAEYTPKFDAIAQDATLTKDAQKEKKMALKKEKEGKFLEILTPEQQTKYKEIIEKKKKEMGKPGA